MLLNVRLGPAEEKVVRGLRRAKVNVSELVRRALREAGQQKPRRVSREGVLDEVLARFPDPSPKSALGRPDLNDRAATRAFIRRKLRRA